MLLLYRLLTRFSAPILKQILKKRIKSGKEDPQRVSEKMGQYVVERPSGSLIWLHAASVGETQSALILIEKLLKSSTELNILVTSGTRTSAALMKERLPKRAFHQYAPLDHPKWVKQFLNHWKPNAALWLESELWPNMLRGLKKKRVPTALINARLSDTSFRRWYFFKGTAKKILSSFKIILAQTERDQERFKKLEAKKVYNIGNIKHCAAPLPFNQDDLSALNNALKNRKTWVYASTHDGEEDFAARIHAKLKQTIPDLLTIIVPRHPERRAEIKNTLSNHSFTSRGEDKKLPTSDNDIYLADTLGELGLFYKASPIAMIGRSFSHDGGGGHNPLEAAQHSCAVLTGPNVQYQQDLFNDMIASEAAFRASNEEELHNKLLNYFQDDAALKKAQDKALNYTTDKLHIVEDIMEHLKPILKKVL